MLSLRRVTWIGVSALLLMTPSVASAFTVDRVTVTGRGQIRENAIMHAEQAAVEIVARRFIAVRVSISRWEMTEQDRDDMIDRLLPHSKTYLYSFEIIEDEVDEAGITEVTAIARVHADRLVMSLRTLHDDKEE
jgi:hypothetical protein